MNINIKGALTKLKSKIKIKKSGKYLKINGKTCKTVKDFLKNVKKLALEDTKKDVEYGEFCSVTLEKLRKEICKSQIKPTSLDKMAYESFLKNVVSDNITTDKIINGLKEMEEADEIFSGNNLTANAIVFYVLRRYNLEHKDDEKEEERTLNPPSKNEGFKEQLRKTLDKQHQQILNNQKELNFRKSLDKKEQQTLNGQEKPELEKTLNEKEKVSESAEKLKRRHSLDSLRKRFSASQPIKIRDQEFKNVKDLKEKTLKDMRNVYFEYENMRLSYYEALKKAEEEVKNKYPEIYKKIYMTDDYRNESFEIKKEILNPLKGIRSMIEAIESKADLRKEEKCFRRYSESQLVNNKAIVTPLCLEYWNEKEVYLKNLENLNNIIKGQYKKEWETDTSDKTSGFRAGISFYKLVKELNEVASSKTEEEALEKIPKKRFKASEHESEYKKVNPNKGKKERKNFLKKSHLEKKRIKEKIENSIKSGDYKKEEIIELIKKYAKFEATETEKQSDDLADILLGNGTAEEDTLKEKKFIKSISENLEVSNLKDYINHADFKGETNEGNEIKGWLEKIK